MTKFFVKYIKELLQLFVNVSIFLMLIMQNNLFDDNIAKRSMKFLLLRESTILASQSAKFPRRYFSNQYVKRLGQYVKLFTIRKKRVTVAYGIILY